MPKSRTFLGSLTLVFVVSAGLLAPAAADVRSGRDQHARLPVHGGGCSEVGGYTCEFSAQSRPRITVHPRRTRPGPNAKRYCRSWLAKEYRVSGPVIVPQMRCWWE
jgi:hypothetical protein